MTTRRDFLKASLGGSALALAAANLGSLAGTASAQEAVTIRVHGRSGVEGDVVNQRAQEISEANPNITVVPELFANTEYLQKIQILIAGGQLGDVVWGSNFNTTYQLWAAKGVYAPLDDFIAADDFDSSAYFPAAWAGQEVNGQIYGITFKAHPSSSLLYFNRDLFAAAGIPDPTDDTTLDDLVAAAEELTGGDTFGYFAAVNDLQHYPTMAQLFGRQLFSEDGTQAQFNSPESLQAMQFDYENIHVRKIAPPRELAPQAPRDLFISGTAAMYKSGTWDLALGKQVQDSFEWSVVQFPVGPQGDRAALFTQDLMGVSSTSPHQPEAWEVVKGLTDQRTGILLGLGGQLGSGNSGTAGGRFDVYESEELRNNPDYTPEVNETRYRALQAAVPMHLAANFRQAEMLTVVGSAMDELWAGTEPTQAWADEINGAIQDILDQPL